jgi:hypothetical protein
MLVQAKVMSPTFSSNRSMLAASTAGAKSAVINGPILGLNPSEGQFNFIKYDLRFVKACVTTKKRFEIRCPAAEL